LYVIKATLEGVEKFNKTVELSIGTKDFRAVETKTNTRVYLSTGVDFSVYTIKGDKITLSNGKLPATVTAPQGATDIVIAS
jgi:hypothetical protein